MAAISTSLLACQLCATDTSLQQSSGDYPSHTQYVLVHAACLSKLVDELAEMKKCGSVLSEEQAITKAPDIHISTKSGKVCFCRRALVAETGFTLAFVRCRDCDENNNDGQLWRCSGAFESCIYQEMIQVPYLICNRCCESLLSMDSPEVHSLDTSSYFLFRVDKALSCIEKNAQFNDPSGIMEYADNLVYDAGKLVFAVSKYEYDQTLQENLQHKYVCIYKAMLDVIEKHAGVIDPDDSDELISLANHLCANFRQFSSIQGDPKYEPNLLMPQVAKKSHKLLLQIKTQYDTIYNDLLSKVTKISDFFHFGDTIDGYDWENDTEICKIKDRSRAKKWHIRDVAELPDVQKWMSLFDNKLISYNTDVDLCKDIAKCLHFNRVCCLLQLNESELVINAMELTPKYNSVSLMNDWNHVLDNHLDNDSDNKWISSNLSTFVSFCKNKDECPSIKDRYFQNTVSAFCKEEKNDSEDTDINSAIVTENIQKIHAALCHGIMLNYADEIKPSNIFIKPQNFKFVSSIQIEETAENTKISLEQLVYQLGERVYYWPYFEDAKPDRYIKCPKYANIKEESLNNDILTMDVRRFERTLKEALMFARTNNGRALKASDSGEWNTRYLVPMHMPVTIVHIYAVLMYCNHCDIQCEWKRAGTQRLHVNEPLHIMKKRNMEIGWWYKYLIEMIFFFGDRAVSSQRGKNSKFYHGFKNVVALPMMFDDFVPQFQAPFSTTTDLIAAQKFAIDGVIVLLESNNNGVVTGSEDPFFDCSWISNFPEERERLFAVTECMRIRDIRLSGQHVFGSNEKEVRALTLLTAMLKGKYIFADLERTKTTHSTQKALLHLISSYENENDQLQKCVIIGADGIQTPRDYVSNMFRCVVATYTRKTEYMLIRCEIEKLHSDLQTKIIDFNDDGTFELSAFCKSLGMNHSNTHFRKEYVWTIENEQFTEFLALGPNQKVSTNGVYLFESKTIQLKFDYLLICSKAHPKVSCFGVEAILLSGMDNVRLSYGFCIDEMKCCCSGVTDQVGCYFRRYANSNRKLLSNKIKIEKLTIRCWLVFER